MPDSFWQGAEQMFSPGVNTGGMQSASPLGPGVGKGSQASVRATAPKPAAPAKKVGHNNARGVAKRRVAKNRKGKAKRVLPGLAARRVAAQRKRG